MTDQPDLAVQEFVFDENNTERKPRTLCGKPISRSEIVLFSQLLVILILYFQTFCIIFKQERQAGLDCIAGQCTGIYSIQSDTEMNKVIPTDNHVFMSLVGPSGSAKTTLLYKLLTLPVFQPRYQSVIFFYQHYQEAYEKLKRNVAEIEFIQGLAFDLINQSFTHDGKKTLANF